MAAGPVTGREPVEEAPDGPAAERADAVVVALVGPLGAGKTLFAKGLAEGLGLDPAEVSSPTFTLLNEYPAPGGVRFVHADLYRIEREDELEAAGFLDALGPGSIVVVEWADRQPDALPTDRLDVRIDPVGPGRPQERRIEVRARGPRSRAVLERWSAGDPTCR